MPRKLVCPECGSDDIRQSGYIDATWGGMAVVNDDETREWVDDGMGGEVYWDSCEVREYLCRACNWSSIDTNSVDEGLEQLAVEKNDDVLPEGLHVQRYDTEYLIVDAQEVPWVTVHRGGLGDLPDIQKEILGRVALALEAEKEVIS